MPRTGVAPGDRLDHVIPETRGKVVVFLMPYAPPSYFGARFFLHEMRASGYRVLYWNVGRLLGYDMTIPCSDQEGMEYREISDFAELSRLIRNETGNATVFVPQISRSLEGFPVLRLLDQAKAKTAFFGWGYLPYSSKRYSGVREKIKKILGARRKIAVLRSVVTAIRLRMQPKLRPYDIVFTAGDLARRLHANDARKFVQIRHFDLETASTFPDSRGEYVGACVFIDEYMPYHPDFRINKSRTISPERYFSNINRCFDHIEEITGRPVVIAACPKAEYHENPYGGRPLVWGKTGQLIHDAALVLTHVSTAVSFAVLHRKPIISLYSDEINALHPEYEVATRALVELLRCPLVDMDNCDIDVSSAMSVNEETYATYYRELLASSEEIGSCGDVVVAAFDELIAEQRDRSLV